MHMYIGDCICTYIYRYIYIHIIYMYIYIYTYIYIYMHTSNVLNNHDCSGRVCGKYVQRLYTNQIVNRPSQNIPVNAW